jgi:tetratricopeptide (TPR) repeat protein
MLCPRCKSEIKDKSLKCSVCGTRIGALCKDCGQYNLINSSECSNCGKILLRICDKCGAANLPEAEVCRKCGNNFDNKNPLTEGFTPAYDAKYSSQQKIKAMLIEGIKNPDTKIITLSGESGSGKNLVLRYAISELTGAKLIWLLGTCSQMTQLSPFGYFQDLLLNFFNINNFCPDTLQLKRNSIKFFRQDFPSLTYEETLDLLNLLYPNNTDIYENIYYNKAKMFTIMKKIITTIVEKMKVVFIIDKFENIDGMSFDFIKELLKDDLIQNRAKFILICNEPKPGMGLISSENLSNENYLDLTIAQFTKNQITEFLKQYKDEGFDADFVTTAEKIGQGIPANIEQLILLKKDINRLGLKNITYKNIESIIEYRLKILQQENIRAYRLLVAMSVLGAKIYPAILEGFDSPNPETFENNINYLVSSGFITPINSLSFEFKTDTLWKVVVSVAKNDPSFEEILNSLFDILKSYHQSSPALLAYISQKLGDNTQAFNTWTILMKYASYIGDIGLYIITQKQALKLIENKNNEFYKKVKKNIYTRVGKLLEPIDYNAALEYLQNAVMMIEDDEDAEHIELLGYISSCSMQAGNYFGVIECVENVLNKLPETMSFEKVLVKTRIVKPLLKLGNYGQLINTVENEIFPEIENALSKGKDTPQISMKDLFDIWLDVYFDLAEALTFQGDNRAFEVIQILCEVVEKNSNTITPATQCKMYLLLALANTIKGDVTTSKRILEDILKENSLDNMDNFIVSRWNFIDILNKFFEKDYAQMQSELFNVVSYANNINDNFTKNILKTLLAKIFKSNNQAKKALEILDKQVAYFAKEKIATGVLLCWYLIADIKLITKATQFALDIATKALDVAQEPNINNYYFMALFNKLIGEIYIAKQDFESAKVYLEKALFLAKKFELDYVQLKTYMQCAKLYQELALPKTNSRTTHVKNALKMFQTMKSIPATANNSFYQKEIKEELSILTSFCKLNGITFKKES